MKYVSVGMIICPGRNKMKNWTFSYSYFYQKNVIYILTGMIYCINITLRKMYLRRISNGKFLRLTILGNFCLIFLRFISHKNYYIISVLFHSSKHIVKEFPLLHGSRETILTLFAS